MNDEDAIGVATMDDDGTIVLRLRSEGPAGAVGDGTIVYPPSHEDYQYVLDHLGGISAGEEKPVPPFVKGQGEPNRAETIVIAANTQAGVGDLRIGAGSFWERDYTDDEGVARRGYTARLWIFIRRPDLPQGQVEERMVVWPGKTFEANAERFRVESLADDEVTLVRHARPE